MAKRKVYCQICESSVEKVSVALCKKLFDKKTKKFYCLQCLANHLDVTTEDLLEKAEEFKAEGCPLFS